MSAELARIAEEAHEDWCIENEARDPWHADSWKYVAEQILAAGYRAPQPRPTAEDIDREALRIVNASRYLSRPIQFLGTLNPDSRAHYRELATHNLEDK